MTGRTHVDFFCARDAMSYFFKGGATENTVAVTAAVVVAAGPLDSMDHASYQQELAGGRQLDPSAVFYSTRVLFRNIDENAALAVSTLPEWMLRPSSLLALLALLPWALVFLRLLSSVRRAEATAGGSYCAAGTVLDICQPGRAGGGRLLSGGDYTRVRWVGQGAPPPNPMATTCAPSSATSQC